MESAVLNYNQLKVLPFKLIYQKCAILWKEKNIDSRYSINKIENMRKTEHIIPLQSIQIPNLIEYSLTI